MLWMSTFLTPQFMTDKASGVTFLAGAEYDKQTDITMPKMKDGNIRRKTRIPIPFGRETIQNVQGKKKTTT